VRSDGKRNNHIVVQDEKHAVFVVDIKIKDLTPVPKSAFEFVHAQGRMAPVMAE
jgi:hypothetical protein